ncbi:hypothetical protein LTS12_027225 [Elasticomyces elasticus]|nr:hypothetical protein LTS12_027225 [Elasticomyces elasticus]
MWDNRDFVLVPKCTRGGNDAGLTGRRIAFVAHVLHESTELLALYHNLETQPLAVPKQYFLARLAWAIFPSMEDFLLAGRERLLTMIDVDTGISETAWFNPAGCKALLNSRRRSRSPSKRKRSTGDDAGGGNEHHDVQNHKRAKTWHHEDGDEDSASWIASARAGATRMKDINAAVTVPRLGVLSRMTKPELAIQTKTRICVTPTEDVGEGAQAHSEVPVVYNGLAAKIRLSARRGTAGVAMSQGTSTLSACAW